MGTVIELDKVSFAYSHVPILCDINLTIEHGEFFGIIGPNAGGKSTLLKLILGLLQPHYTGSIKVFGNDAKKARTRIGYVPQHPTFPRDFPITVQEVVLLGYLGKCTHWYGGYTKADKMISMDALKMLEIDHIYKQKIQSLSGGQIQRVLIARALVSKPDILILDEPTANIDSRSEAELFALLAKYNTNMTIIVVSHDIGFISSYVNRVGCLNKTMQCHTTSAITGKTIEELYGTHVKMIRHTAECKNV